LADLAVVERRLEKTRKTARAGDKDAQAELVVLERVLAELDAGRGAREAGESEEAVTFLRQLGLLTAKPILYAANVSEAGFSAASSAPRPLRTRSSCGWDRTRRRASKDWCARRGGTTWCRTATSCCSGSTSNTCSTAGWPRTRCPYPTGIRPGRRSRACTPPRRPARLRGSSRTGRLPSVRRPDTAT